MCVTNSAFSLRKPWANSERDSIVPLSSLMCNSALGVFKIQICIMRGKKTESSQKICLIYNLLDNRQMSKKALVYVFVSDISERYESFEKHATITVHKTPFIILFIGNIFFCISYSMYSTNI